MLQAMFSGVSGLQVHQTDLDVIGNNIANINTVGYKAGRVTFEDQLSQTIRDAASPGANVGGQNPAQVGLGVMLGSVDTLQTQGNLETTGKNTDLAIQGAGYFLVGDGSTVYYTRDGSFDLDSSGELVNPANGVKLLGYQADANGKVDTSQPITASSVIKIPVGTLTAVKQTTEATFQGNLDASSSLQSTTAKLTGNLDVSQTPPAINTTIYDSLGNAHTLQVTFSNPVFNPTGAGVPAGATQSWNVALTLDGATTNQTIYAVGGKFVFANSSGAILGSSQVLNVIGSGGAPNFPITVDFSGLSDSSSVSASANGQNTPTKIASTLMSLSGNMNLDNPPAPVTTTVYDSAGNAYQIQTTFLNPTYNPTGPNVPTGATAAYDVQIKNLTTGTTLYDSTVAGNNESKAYYIPGQGFVLTNTTTGAVLGNTIQLSSAPGTYGPNNTGAQVVAGMPLTVDLSKLSTTNTTGAADGRTGSQPSWSTAVQVYDSLGMSHLITFNFTRALVGSGAPSNAAARWEWTATENGHVISSSTSSGNQALFFDSSGNLIDTNNQTVNVTPTNGAAPFSVSINFGSLTQIAGNSSVAATSQDGAPMGVLQSFSIAQDGTITGVFSNGQTRVLGQIATAIFSNPGGLAKQGQNLYSASSNSGLAQVGVPNQGGRGQINVGFLEMSNVDLSTEFTNLIIAERGFQANTRIVTTVDNLLQDVINLKQGG